ncbi:MAG: hypothetical protein GF329_09145 [Candidatus Lokiarchaeota archaeon]|nr:hypothetical protein [Candidatus Lokiarchaeota archaeon]
MRFSYLRLALIGILFSGAIVVPTIFHTQLIPMIQMTTLSRQIIHQEGTGDNVTTTLMLNKTMKWIQSIEYNDEESNGEKAVFDLNIVIPNNATGADYFNMKIPGLDLSLYYKAGYPFVNEKNAIMGWRNLDLDYISNTTNFPEPGDSIPLAYDTLDGSIDGVYFPYDGERWVKLISIESDESNILPGAEAALTIKMTLHGGKIESTKPKPSALSQFIGTMLRNLMSGRGLPDGILHLKGDATISNFPIPIDFDVPNILPSSLDISELINTFLNPEEDSEEEGGAADLLGGIELALNFTELIEQVGLFDIQNYNDSNNNYQRDYSGYTDEGLKNWTEPLFQNGAFTASILIKIAQDFGVKGLDILFPRSTFNLDNANSSEIWNPSNVLVDSDLINELFFYIPKELSDFLDQPNFSRRVFGLLGFANDMAITADDMGEGEIVAGGTMRLLADTRDENFTLSNVFSCYIQGILEGMIGMGMFGSIDLKIGELPLSLLLNLPLTIPLGLEDIMSLQEEGEGSGIGDMLGGFLSDPLNAFGLNSIGLNGIALDTYEGLAQLNTSIDMDLSFPFGLYLPTEVQTDEEGNIKPYLGASGGPIGLYINPKPSDWVNLSGVEKNQWKKENLLFELPSLDDPYLQESMANIIKDIARLGEGQGIAYHFDDGIVESGNPAEYGNLSNYYDTKNKLPEPANTKTNLEVTMDQLLLNLSSLIPNFGDGFFRLIESIGIDSLFIEYLNNSMNGGLFNNLDKLLEMNISRFLDIIYQSGPKNDLFDYLLDSNKTYTLEPVTVINATYDKGYYISMEVNHSGIKEVHALYDSMNIDTALDYWDSTTITAINLTQNESDWESRLILNANGTTIGGVYNIYQGMITINCTGLNRSLLPNLGDTLYINYTSNKLDLFSLSELLDSLLADGGLSFGSDTESSMGIINEIPNIFASMGLDLDNIIPELLKYLIQNISDPITGYGIKPFEMLDVAMIKSSMGGDGDGGDALGGLSSALGDSNMINALIESVVKKILNKVDPFGLMYEMIGNPLPMLDYLNRSKILTEDFIIPLVAELFAGEGSMFSDFPWDPVLDALVPIISELLSGPGDTIIENHGALNIFSMLSLLDTAKKMTPNEVDSAADWVPIYTNGPNNYTVDKPPYNNLRLVSNVVNGLLNSGLDAEDLWVIIELLFGFGLYGGFGEEEEPEGGGFEDLTGDVSDLIGLIGFMAPSGEWISVLRELGIFSRWEGDWECWIEITLWIFSFTLPLHDFIGRLLNLEKFLSTGYLELLPDMGMVDPMLLVQLSVNENQTYSNPWHYYAGYDSSHNTGPYQGIATTDNWGWVPQLWDPGDPEADPPTYPQKGAEYPKSFIQNVISALPLAIDIEIPEVAFEDLEFSFIADFSIDMILPIDLPIRLRLQGNPWYLVQYLEESGFDLMGIATHFLGPTLNDLLLDILSPSETNESESAADMLNTIMDKILADPVALIQGVFNSNTDLMHVLKYFFDPEYMPASEWKVDSSYVDPGFVLGEENLTSPTLYWDRMYTIGDNDQIPDEFPWYRFSIARFNQDPALVNVGPGSEASRNPAIIDQLTPDGPPGSGKWIIAPDGISDGMQHYWYDTPFAYVNASVPLDDPLDPYYIWLDDTYDPIEWNDYYTSGGAYGPINPITGDALVELDDQYWDNAIAPFYSLYYVPPGTEEGQTWHGRNGVGVAGRLPNPTLNYPIQEASTSYWSTSDDYGYFPNIWWCFNDTLDQTDYRFGYWDSYYNEILEKDVTFLNTQPFWDLMSWGVGPHITGAIDLLDVASIIEDLFAGSGPTTTLASPGDLLAGFGEDYYHTLMYDEVYKKYGIPEDYGLSPFGLLQWIWDGAGTYYDKTDDQRYYNVEPYTIPNLDGALDWLADRGITIEFIINNLPSILDEFLSSDTPSSQDYGELMGTETITGLIRGLEEYFTVTVGQNEFGNPNQTEGMQVFLEIMRDIPLILDVYPMKIMRSLLNQLLPQLGETGLMDGSSTGTESDPLSMIKDTGILDLIMLPKSERPNLNMNLSICDTSLDFYLFGQKIENIELSNISIPLDMLLGGDSGSGSGSGGGSIDTSILSDIPLDIPGGIPHLEISTFHGPFDINFELKNQTHTAAYVPVVLGEAWYNETVDTYYLNRTESFYEYNNNIFDNTSRWIGSAQYNNLTYVRDEFITSNASGIVDYSSVIEKDLFGWLEPFIYIHVEDPVYGRTQDNGWAGDYYWWNLSTQSTKYTLAGNRPILKGRWITDGDQFILKGSQEFDENVLQIDSDNNLEIFSMAEIDDKYMGKQTVYYIPVGDIPDPLQVSGNLNIFGDSYNGRDIKGSLSAPTQANQYRYVYEKEYTPTANMLEYPTISEVIETVTIESNPYWIDDSIVYCDVYYTNLTDDRILAYNFTLPSVDQDIFTNERYDGKDSNWIWHPTDDEHDNWLIFNYTYNYPGENMRISQLDIDALNFGGLSAQSGSIFGAAPFTIDTVRLLYNVTYDPSNTTESTWASNRIFSNSFARTKNYPIWFHQNSGSQPLIIQGYTSGGTEIDLSEGTKVNQGANYAWFNYTYTIPTNEYIHNITWGVRNLADNASTSSDIDTITIQYFNDTDGNWNTLMEINSLGEESYGHLDNFTATGHDYVALTGGQNRFGTDNYNYWNLFLSHRAPIMNTSALENVSLVKFAAKLSDSANDLGYDMGKLSYNTSAWVQFFAKEWTHTWGVETGPKKIELPNGFISNYVFEIQLYDPLANYPEPVAGTDRSNWDQRFGRIFDISLTERPEINISQTMYGPIEDGSSIFPLSFNFTDPGDVDYPYFAKSVSLYIESWDSLVKDDGKVGDIWYIDNYQVEGSALTLPNIPTVNVSITYIDLEGNINLNVTIRPNVYLRDFFLNMTQGYALGYIDDISISTDTNDTNSGILRRLGKFPIRHTLTWYNGSTKSLKIGEINLLGYDQSYKIMYYFSFLLTPEFVTDAINLGRSEAVYFRFVWTTKEGSYEVTTNRASTSDVSVNITLK